MQLFCDLKKAAANSQLSWPEKDIKLLKDLELKEFYGPEMHWEQGVERWVPPEYEEIISVLEYLQEVKG